MKKTILLLLCCAILTSVLSCNKNDNIDNIDSIDSTDSTSSTTPTTNTEDHSDIDTDIDSSDTSTLEDID